MSELNRSFLDHTSLRFIFLLFVATANMSCVHIGFLKLHVGKCDIFFSLDGMSGI